MRDRLQISWFLGYRIRKPSVMSQMSFPKEFSQALIEEQREYLKLIARMQFNMRLRVKEDPSDIVQRVMLEACHDWKDFRGTSEVELRAWLSKITANVIASLGRHYSRQKRAVSREMPFHLSLQQSSTELHRCLIAKDHPPEHAVLAAERGEQLVAALLKLLEEERTAIVLKHLHQWTVSEIADHLQRTEAAVAGLLRRGLSKLRILLSGSE